jgi:hypothetical protein
MKPFRNFALCLAILGLSLPAAADQKSVHAAICQTQYLESGASLSYAESLGIVAVGGFVYVVCPLMRDRINSTTSLSSAAVEVYVPSGGEVYCALYSQGEDSGGAGTTVDFDSGNRTTAGEGQINLSVDSSNGNEGAYGLFCSLTEDSQIHHIQTNESDSASD